MTMSAALFFFLFTVVAGASAAEQLCTSPNNVFHVRVDLFASE